MNALTIFDLETLIEGVGFRFPAQRDAQLAGGRSGRSNGTIAGGERGGGLPFTAS